jgi:endogenous inhibitor of DNA gyrase (YacG/DUF329 family)
VNKIMKIKCPECDTIFDYYQSQSRPFCSDKCKMIDLGHWFHESYRIPTKESGENEIELEEENNSEE